MLKQDLLKGCIYRCRLSNNAVLIKDKTFVNATIKSEGYYSVTGMVYNSVVGIYNIIDIEDYMLDKISGERY